MKKLTVLILFLAICLPVRAYIAHNQIECLFTAQCTTDKGGSDDLSLSKSGYVSDIRYFVIESAFYLLSGNQNYQDLLKTVELSELYGIDYKDLENKVSIVITDLEKAELIYSDLVSITANLVYENVKIKKLTVYDYENAGQSKIPIIWEKVKNILSKGDVRGALKTTHQDVKNLIDNLKSIKDKITLKKFPLSDFRQTNQLFFETQLFAQYCAEVYSKI
jgi:hypothetical protein